MRDRVRLVDIRDSALSVGEVRTAVADDSAGGEALFVGAVRDHDGGREVERLSYTAHPSALDRLGEVAQRVAQQYPVLGIAAVHRVGDLEVGDLAVVVAASCPHRGDAFAACRALIDDLKVTVPIWKHQLFRDGTQEWVGTP